MRSQIHSIQPCLSWLSVLMILAMELGELSSIYLIYLERYRYSLNSVQILNISSYRSS